MSTQNASLTDFLGQQDTNEDTTPARDERPNWAPTTDASTNQCCQNCNAPVNAHTARVFGTINNNLQHCFECVTATAMKKGAGVDPEFTDDEDASTETDVEADTAGLPDYMIPGGGE